MSANSSDPVAALAADLARSLIALDFDGTLAPIVRDPTTSRPVGGALEVLAALARGGAQLAVITGRDACTAVDLGGFDAVPGIVVAGLYGAELWHDGQLETVEEPQVLEVLERLRAELPTAIAAVDDDLWIEDKRLSLVVHARRAARPEAALEQVRPYVAALAARLGLETHEGKQVLEIRIPGYDKGRALRQLVDRFGPQAVLFAGDDLGDLPAFAVIGQLRAAGLTAWGIAVAAAGADARLSAAADSTVNDPAGLIALLRTLMPAD